MTINVLIYIGIVENETKTFIRENHSRERSGKKVVTPNRKCLRPVEATEDARSGHETV